MGKHRLFSHPIFFCLLVNLTHLTCGIFFWKQIFSGSLAAGWHDRKAEGWAWYEEGKKIVEEELFLTPVEQMEHVRHQLEEKLATALLEPTPENIKFYMEEQQKWIERSSHFAQIWAQVLLTYPRLDYTATHLPVSQYGLQLYRHNLQEEREQLIASLVSDYGLFFFYEGKNNASLLFGRLVQEFAKKYGWHTVAVSVDGVEIEGFDHSRENNGIVQTLGVDLLPAIYLINPKSNLAVPIAFGLVAIDQIENNIALQFQEGNHE